MCRSGVGMYPNSKLIPIVYAHKVGGNKKTSNGGRVWVVLS
jgi:hypothetical protein